MSVALPPVAVYRVGGAVRDALLGEPVHDRDYVVCGLSPEAMIAGGFLAVGKDFPVFLHPKAHCEVALARTERKTAAGYHGFAFHAAPDVTIEADLARRDLTINAMAVPLGLNEPSVGAVIDAIAADQHHHTPATASILDPFGGQADLRQGLLRHVTEAFAEDPVRILRLARFAARWPHFQVATDTQTLMHNMVQAGEADTLVAERVWAELQRGLMARRPSRMLAVLADCGAWARLVPPKLAKQAPDPSAAGQLLDAAAADAAPLGVRFALLCSSFGGEQTATPSATLAAFSERWKPPQACTDLANLFLAQASAVTQAQPTSPMTVLQLLQRADALRRPERFAQLLQAVAIAQPQAPPLQWLSAALAAVRSVDAGAAAAAASAQVLNVPQAVDAARLAALAHHLRQGPSAN